MKPRPQARRRRMPSPVADALPFQEPLEALIAEPPPRILRGLHWLVALLFVGLLALAAQDFEHKKDEIVQRVDALCRKFPLYQ